MDEIVVLGAKIDNAMILGILAILFGIFVMIFPYITGLAFSVIFGFVFTLYGVYCLFAAFKLFSLNKLSAVGYGILGILAIICGLMLVFNVFLFAFLVSINIYLVGFMLLFGGILSLLSVDHQINKISSASIILLGLIIIIVGYLTVIDPVIIAFIVGISSIIKGITLIILGEEFKLD